MYQNIKVYYWQLVVGFGKIYLLAQINYLDSFPHAANNKIYTSKYPFKFIYIISVTLNVGSKEKWMWILMLKNGTLVNANKILSE